MVVKMNNKLSVSYRTRSCFTVFTTARHWTLSRTR